MATSEDTDTSTAPGELELVRRFVNTYDAELDTDEISHPGSLSEWLSGAGLSDEFDASPGDVERVRSAREALRALLFANNGSETDGGDAGDRLNDALAGCSLEVRFEDGRAVLAPVGTGADVALARIGAIVREAMLDGTWERLKACPADDCQWAFYDRSRNRSRTWCNMELCGNRSKVRAFRERRSG
ncbi:MAG TPA: CGNR zinc finger domain-containing protein [Solirubrobacterales bacterium]|nr:CGNR zinc finger domain-containing protein [Solirubrobacterales bacterium]